MSAGISGTVSIDLGWERIVDSVVILNGANGTCEIYPSTGKKFVGGGFYFGGQVGGVDLVYNRPTAAGDAWQVQVYNGSGVTINLYTYGVAIYAS